MKHTLVDIGGFVRIRTCGCWEIQPLRIGGVQFAMWRLWFHLKYKIDKHKSGASTLAFRQDRWSRSWICALPTDWVSRWQALPHTVGRVWGACRGALRLCVISKYPIRHAGHLALNPWGRRILTQGCMTARRCANVLAWGFPGVTGRHVVGEAFPASPATPLFSGGPGSCIYGAGMLLMPATEPLPLEEAFLNLAPACRSQHSLCLVIWELKVLSHDLGDSWRCSLASTYQLLKGQSSDALY